MRSFFSKKPEQLDGVSFLTTQGMSYHLEEMFLQAEKQIVIIAPYIQIHKKLKSILTDKSAQGVKITIVCRTKDLKDDLDSITTSIIDNPKLHAKCYLTEKSALIGSLNLYDFSQVNNDEMGVLIENSGMGCFLYGQVEAEARRLTKGGDQARQRAQNPQGHGLVEGKKYNLNELDAVFDFDYKKMSGIKRGKSGDIILFSSSTSKYANQFENGALLYQGQNTGPGAQKLIYGNKDLYEAYGNDKTTIYLFADFIYSGCVYVSSKPYTKNGVWFFPLSKKA
jgi:hypothetical protein